MARDKEKWKDLQKNESGGGYLYIGKQDLERLQRKGGLDPEGDIEYSVTVGVSDGRSRAFIGLRNAGEEGQQ